MLLPWPDISEELLENAPLCILLVDATGRITRANNKITALFGYTPEEITGQPLSTLLPERYRAGHMISVRDFFSQPAVRSMGAGRELNGLHRDGREIPVEIGLVPLKQGPDFLVAAFIMNISTRRKAERELQLIKFCFDRAPQGVFVLDEDGSTSYVNEKACQALGYTSAELTGMPMWHYDPAFSRERWKKQWETARQEKVRTFESTHRRKDGSIIPVEISTAHVDYQGRELHVAFVQDISARKETERLATHSKNLHKLSKMGMTLSGEPDVNFENIVRFIADLFQVRVVCLSEISGNDLLFKAVYTDGEVHMNAGRCGLAVTPCANVEKSREIQIYDQVRERFPQASFLNKYNAYSYCGFPAVDKSGAVVAVTCLLDDRPHEFSEDDQEILHLIGQRISLELEHGMILAERRRMENSLQEINQRFRIIFDQAGVGVSMCNAATGQFVEVNRKYCEIVGYTQEELRTLNFRKITHPDDLELQDRMTAGFLAGRYPEYEIEKRYTRKDGSIVWVHLTCSALWGPGEEPGYHIAVVQDITDRKTIEDELARHREHLQELVQQRTLELEAARDTAEQANRAKSEFLSTMSHELRTPLHSILGFCQYLNDNPETSASDWTVALEHILKSGHHLLELINDVLDLSRIEAGKLELSMENIELSGLITECMALTHGFTTKKEIAINIRDHAGRSVYADRTRLKQVLLNLLSNAIKYNHYQGSVTVDFESCPEERVRIIVRDTGKGIPQNQHDRVFMPYRRIRRLDSEVEGTGIGLTISKRLVEAMGGTIGFTSQEGAGSAFWFELPVRSRNMGDTSATTSPANAGTMSGAISTMPTGRVLYIEDTSANVQLMHLIIRRLPGVELLDASTAEQGITIARETQPDLILMDIDLPGMDGIEALCVLRQDPATHDIPVVAVSAAAMPHDQERIQQAGFDDYISKPFDIQKIPGLITRYL